MFNVPLTDLAVLVWFFVCWAGYAYFAGYKSGKMASLLAAMQIYRHDWFTRMLGRNNRIGDIEALNSLTSGATFFASTSLLILGGLAAMLGTTSKVIDVVAGIPFADHDSELVWLIKIGALMGIYIYAFFKFTWSIRQYSFCTVLVGAAPVTDKTGEHEDFVFTLTSVASLASESNNQGLRAFYFALAALTWFVHPLLFAMVSALVVHVLYRREFHSLALLALSRPELLSRSLHLPKQGSAQNTEKIVR